MHIYVLGTMSMRMCINRGEKHQTVKEIENGEIKC